MPTFSICLLTHNNASHLQDALASVRAQTITDWECLISDDASTDATREVLIPWLEDHRFRYVRHERNLGQADNWAAALRMANGHFLTTLHADDSLLPSGLERYLAAFEKDRDLVWANWGYFDTTLTTCLRDGPVTDGEFSGASILDWVVRNNPMLPSATAFTRELLLKTGFPDDRCGIFCDRDFFLRMAACAASAYAIGERLLRYRQHGQSVTSASTTNGRLQGDAIKLGSGATERFAGVTNGRMLARVLRRRCGETVFTSAWDMVLTGKISPGARWILEACHLAGWSLVHPSVLTGFARATKARVMARYK